ncbi:MAG: adenylosuccinate synthetase [Arhodomonas sp.]|nr:adenylosuccinate synthetase [Arhodomonas sp.]
MSWIACRSASAIAAPTAAARCCRPGPRPLAECEPEYVELPGWQCSTVGIRRYEDLPEAARTYLQRIEELVGVPVAMISTGCRPARYHRAAKYLTSRRPGAGEYPRKGRAIGPALSGNLVPRRGLEPPRGYPH